MPCRLTGSSKSIAVQLGLESHDESSGLDDLQYDLGFAVTEFQRKQYPGGWWKSPLVQHGQKPPHAKMHDL
eukprot:CAMPEP_0174344716 /NCGR_PEP_ID=MMETSP0810-20121108/27828_1 /TAXON_ID=73025 ORGANISM="Eutreptiella gymnastica-like, Strain CCMP1594" /NCGR_SAMPLE_ID=MMETSP0810 /ASSEMBLY_ACC=CAM_ASM_000659 /LENGTH=70 /DNA_ID=CAMNT_0015467907 /DNA_START=937 /DNA_END=1149 /DNA_ORIENTATION=-